MLQRLIAAMSLFFASTVALAQATPLKAESDARSAADTIVRHVAEGKWKKGWEVIRSVSVIPENELNVAEAQIVGEMEKVAARFGAVTGDEFIVAEKVGARVVRYQYLVHYKNAPIRWMLVFYQSQAGWVLTDFKFDANYGALFPRGA
jgi:hypothetical protein